MTSYDAVTPAYTRFIYNDPVKHYSQYPTVLRALGKVRGSRILDIGCGSGLFSRLLVRHGAHVLGYDISRTQIRTARRFPRDLKVPISYRVARPHAFASPCLFHAAVSIAVLPYARTLRDLQQFFSSAKRHLLPNAPFVSITLNPRFENFGITRFGRRFTKHGHTVRVTFVHHAQRAFGNIPVRFFSRAQYELAAHRAGFLRCRWSPLIVTATGVRKQGTRYWRGFRRAGPYVTFLTR